MVARNKQFTFDIVITKTIKSIKMNSIKLPYSEGALAPFMSEETLKFHYGKHYQTYLSNLNKLIAKTKFETLDLVEIVKNSEGGIFNNASQLFNHEFFFQQLSPFRKKLSKGKLYAAIERDFNSFENFKEEFSTAANTLFGSGWAWLSKDDKGKLYITQESNAGTPLKQENRIPILCFDVWEHAYYLDYQNRRVEYTQALWGVIDWDVVEARYQE